jgi:hypothetical protein
MKKKFILILLACMLMSGVCKKSANTNEQENTSGTNQVFDLDTTKLNSGQTYFQCTMDPEVISNEPGKCPKCGMDLTERKKH